MKHYAGLDPGRHKHRRHPNAETIKCKFFVPRVARSIGRDGTPRWRGVIRTAPVLVKGHNEQRILPVLASANRLPDLPEELFSEQHIVRRVLVVWFENEARLDE